MLRNELESLRSLLIQAIAGPLPEQTVLVVLEHLEAIWHQLGGATATEMAARKLERATDWVWDPPVLSFTIVRHGAAVAGGSKKGERQRWQVDLAQGTATVSPTGFVLLEQRSPPFDADSPAERIAWIVQTGPNPEAADEGITWLADDQVRIRLRAFVPTDGPSQTVTGRVRRLREATTSRLDKLGWEVVQTNPLTLKKSASLTQS
jgi:hypothetical protein